MLADVLLEAGVPAGAVSVIPGPGRVGGQRSSSATPASPRSASPARAPPAPRSCGRSSDNITRLSLELGGKSACIVFDDADLDKAIAATPMSVFDNTGQDCCARSRFLVQRAVYDEFVEGFVAGTEALVIGDPLDEATQLGPMISEGQRRTCLEYLEIGAAEGATPLCGGEASAARLVPHAGGARRRRQLDAGRPGGDLRPGRVRSSRSTPRPTPIRIANDSPYGLSGSLWTNGPRPGHPGHPGGAHRRDLGEHAPQRAHRGALRRLQAVGHRAASSAWRRWTTTPRSRTSSSATSEPAMPWTGLLVGTGSEGSGIVCRAVTTVLGDPLGPVGTAWLGSLSTPGGPFLVRADPACS